MERVRVTGHSVDADAVALTAAVGVLQRGRLVGYPTETFYGIAADPRDDAAVARVFEAKGRVRTVALPLIAGSLAQVLALTGELPIHTRALMGRFWPGPLTLVIPAWPGLARAIHGGAGTVAVRVPAHPIARGLAAAYGYPVTSTSANVSGEPACASPNDVEASLGACLEILLDGGDTAGGPPSTIVDVTGQAPRLIRTGAVVWEQVLECLSK
jgi:L-threonylcarbamoyladenylate synthase